MAYIKEYWNDKGKRAEQAKKHIKHMDAMFLDRMRERLSKLLKNTWIQHINVLEKLCLQFPREEIKI